MAGVATIVGIGIGLISLSNQQDAADEQKQAAERQQQALQDQTAEQRKQFESQQRIADIQNQRSRAELARQARIAKGQIESVGANTGTTFSSGIAGAIGSVATQAATQGGVFNAIAANQNDITGSKVRESYAIERGGQAHADAIIAGANMSSAQSLFGLGMDIFKAGGGWKTIFDMPKKTA
jgi:cytochrome c-type biogenesis protein CcmH/NrfG